MIALTITTPECDCSACLALRLVEAAVNRLLTDPSMVEAVAALGREYEEAEDIPLGLFNANKTAADMLIRVSVFNGLSVGLEMHDIEHAAREGISRATNASDNLFNTHTRGRA